MEQNNGTIKKKTLLIKMVSRVFSETGDVPDRFKGTDL